MEYAPGSESAALTGDYVGVESCIDLRNEEDFEAYVKDCERSYGRRRLRRRREAEMAEERGGGWKGKEVREFPPPITFLARTENQSSHMPWVMKRYYTEDGRLVIREEKVRHHEYLRAHRADGRLTLQLIPLDSSTYDIAEAAQLNRNTNCTIDTKNANDEDVQASLEGIPLDADSNEDVTEVVNEKTKEEEYEEEAVARVMVTSVSMAALCISEGVKNGGMMTSASSSSLAAIGGGNKCYGFNSLRSSSASSLFHLQVPAIRPVIS